MTTGPLAFPLIPGVEPIRLIATTRSSMVWLAYQESMDRRVAVKVLSSTSPAANSLFDQERHALGRLSTHRRILTIYASGTDQGRLYLILQYADGGTLRDRLRTGNVPPSEIGTLAAAIAEALHVVHDAGMVHADLKPSNILLDSLTGPLLADLGLSRFEAAAGASGFSLTYAAPELLRGQPATAASDMYSFGVVLYEILTGRPPFDPAEDQSVLGFAQRVANSDPADIPAHMVSVPDLRQLTRLLLAKTPEERPTAQRALQLLRPESETVRAAPPHPPIGRTRRRRLAALSAAAVAALAVGIGVSAFVSHSGGSTSVTPSTPTLAVEAPTASPSPPAPEPTTMPSSTSATLSSSASSASSDETDAATTTTAVEIIRESPWQYGSYIAPDRWAASTSRDRMTIDVINLNGLTPMSPTEAGDEVWISAASEDQTAGGIFIIEATSLSVSRGQTDVVPSGRALVDQDQTGVVPLLAGDTGGLRAISDDPTIDGTEYSPGATPYSPIYLKPDPSEWPGPVLAYSFPAATAEPFGITPQPDEGSPSFVQKVFPSGASQPGEPGPILKMGAVGAEFAYIAEQSSDPFAGASIIRWPLLGGGPPTYFPIDPSKSGAVQDVLHLSPDGSIWTESRERIVTRFDPVSNRVTGVVAAGPCPTTDELVGCKFLTDDASHGLIAHGAFWIGNPVDGRLYRIDLDSVEITDSYAIGATPGTPAATQTGVWISDLDTGSVVRIDAASRSVTHRFELPCYDTRAAQEDLAPAVADCESFSDGIDWRYRPTGTDDSIWLPWQGMLYRLHEPEPADDSADE